MIETKSDIIPPKKKHPLFSLVSFSSYSLELEDEHVIKYHALHFPVGVVTYLPELWLGH